MSVRQVDWRDLPAFHRCRDESIYLDSALLLTRGDHFFTGILFSLLAPTASVFTCITNDSRGKRPYLIGQFSHAAGSPLSHLTFLSPSDALQVDLVNQLIDYMLKISGERGALRMLAEVEEKSEAFDALRKCGFVIYNRQHIWKLSGLNEKTAVDRSWRAAVEGDSIAIRNLYNNLVPGLVQQIEPFPLRRPRGMVYHYNGELLGYAEVKQGQAGIWILPFIHPDAQDFSELLISMVKKIPNRANRPVYMCVRTNQSWMEPLIEELGAEAGAHQAVLARQLAVQQKAGRAFTIPSLETGQAEISVPIAHVEMQQGYAPEKNNR